MTDHEEEPMLPYRRDPLDSLLAMLVHASGRVVAGELAEPEVRSRHLVPSNWTGSASAVEFTDGTIILLCTQYGFAGSEWTPAEPVEVVYTLLTPG